MELNQVYESARQMGAIMASLVMSTMGQQEECIDANRVAKSFVDSMWKNLDAMTGKMIAEYEAVDAMRKIVFEPKEGGNL